MPSPMAGTSNTASELHFVAEAKIRQYGFKPAEVEGSALIRDAPDDLLEQCATLVPYDHVMFGFFVETMIEGLRDTPAESHPSLEYGKYLASQDGLDSINLLTCQGPFGQHVQACYDRIARGFLELRGPDHHVVALGSILSLLEMAKYASHEELLGISTPEEYYRERFIRGDYSRQLGHPRNQLTGRSYTMPSLQFHRYRRAFVVHY